MTSIQKQVEYGEKKRVVGNNNNNRVRKPEGPRIPLLSSETKLM